MFNIRIRLTFLLPFPLMSLLSVSLLVSLSFHTLVYFDPSHNAFLLSCPTLHNPTPLSFFLLSYVKEAGMGGLDLGEKSMNAQFHRNLRY